MVPGMQNFLCFVKGFFKSFGLKDRAYLDQEVQDLTGVINTTLKRKKFRSNLGNGFVAAQVSITEQPLDIVNAFIWCDTIQCE